MRILYVGDTACLPDDLSDYIGDMGDEWTVETVADGKSAMFAVANGPVDVVMVGPALADLPQATFASKVEVADGKASVTREVDGGLQTIKLKGPAIVTTDLRLNEPRYASLPNIMKAKKKPLEEKTASDYGVDVTPRLTVVKTSEPAGRKAGVKVGSVDELIAKLKEAGVL